MRRSPPLPPRPGSTGTEDGFTLIEVLVALAVLGAVLATAYGVFASGLRNISRGDERLTLALMAESLLNRADLDLAQGGGGAVEGSLPDGVRWRITRQPYDLERLKEGLTVVERPLPPRPGAGGSLLDPTEGGEGGPLGRREDDRGGYGPGAREGGGGFGLNAGDRRGAGTGERRSGLGDPSGGGGPSFGAGEGRQPGSVGGRPGRAGSGAAPPVKLKAWLVRVEVANARGESFALAKLSLEREQRGQGQGQGQGLGQGLGRERAP